MTEIVERPQTPPRLLGWKATILAAAGAVASFHLAFDFQPLAFLIAAYLLCLFALAWAKSTRAAFYTGLAVGLAICVPQLWFLRSVFGVAAVALWLAVGLGTALFLLAARSCVGVFGAKAAALAIPVLWTGWEYVRGELNPLRFTWLNAGQALSGAPAAVHMDVLGVYGAAFAIMALIAAGRLLPRRFALPGGVLLLGGLAAITNLAPATAPWSPGAVGRPSFGQTTSRPQSASGRGLPQTPRQPTAPGTPSQTTAPAADGESVPGPYVVGVQLEFPSEKEVLGELDRAVAAHPDADVLMLSEYTFHGPVPARVRAWCRDNRRHLIAGGVVEAGQGPGQNTAFVIGPDGNVVFSQAKSVPVQFFADGPPATERNVWPSPWGKIGICVCYDLGYSRVMDDFVRQEAAAIICIVLDKISWTAQEHVLHAKVGPVRAAEYRVPVVRACSSGISQIVLADGTVVATAPYPGRGEMVAGRLPMAKAGRLPLDRYLCPACVALAAGAVLALLVITIRRRRHGPAASEDSGVQERPPGAVG